MNKSKRLVQTGREIICITELSFHIKPSILSSPVFRGHISPFRLSECLFLGQPDRTCCTRVTLVKIVRQEIVYVCQTP